jgi:subtilisin family serine protease
MVMRIERAAQTFLILLTSGGCLSAVSFAIPKQFRLSDLSEPAVPGEYFVKVRSEREFLRAMSQEMAGFSGTYSTSPILSTKFGNWYRIRSQSLSAEEKNTLELLVHREVFISVEPNLVYKRMINEGGEGRQRRLASSNQSDPDYLPLPELPEMPIEDTRLAELYGLSKISAKEAWSIKTGSKSIVVANIDTGIDYNHQDLANNVWRNPSETCNDNIDNDGNGFVDDCIGWDFYNKDSKPADDDGHGTHTAGTIGATGDNGIGISGVAKLASIMSLKFLGGPSGSGTLEDAVASITYATQNGAKILSNSWGGGGFSQLLYEAISAANEKDILFVAAAGNSATNNDLKPTYPASYSLPNIISVASTDKADKLSRFSCFGKKSVHLAAPGSTILSTLPDSTFGQLSGTSMATPHVTGAALILKAAYPQLDAIAIKGLLMDGSDRMSNLTDKIRSGGRINVVESLRLARLKFGEPAQ